MNRTLIIAAAALAGLLAVAGCTHGPSVPSGQQQENRQQAQDTASLVNNQPIPHFNFSVYRQTLIDAESIAANGTQTTSFFFNQGVRDPIFSCPSLGMPVPNTAQLSNPQQVQWNTAGSSGVASATVGQMDPYGAYTPSSSTGTYVICVNSSGKPYLQYWEGFVQSVTAPAVWDYGTHTLKVTGAPSYTIKTKANR
jgi:hypothetical protein